MYTYVHSDVPLPDRLGGLALPVLFLLISCSAWGMADVGKGLYSCVIYLHKGLKMAKVAW